MAFVDLNPDARVDLKLDRMQDLSTQLEQLNLNRDGTDVYLQSDCSTVGRIHQGSDQKLYLVIPVG